jgi:hypothetical protein
MTANNNNDDDERIVRVAIIGAGFAGLALAMVLQDHQRCTTTTSTTTTSDQGHDEDDHDTPVSASVVNNSNSNTTTTTTTTAAKISYRIFESKDRPIPIIGTIHLPSARAFLQQVDLWDDAVAAGVFAKSSQSQDDDDDDVDGDHSKYADIRRENFLELLRKRVVEIQTDCRIVDVVVTTTNTANPSAGNQSPPTYMLVDDGNGTKYGEFDLVVLADGLFGERTLLRHPCVAARIGDCLWYSDRPVWWDFGTTRIRQGADQAIRDAMELGEQLIFRVEHDKGWRQRIESLGRFSLPSSVAVTKSLQQKAFFLAILAPVVTALLHRLWFVKELR